MADPTKTNGASGTASTSNPTASFGFTATAGRLLLVTVGADDYNNGDPSGYTPSNGYSQETYLGSYVWWKIAAGTETSFTYALNGTAESEWTVTEFDNIDATPYDISDGQLNVGSKNSYTTPPIIPSTGRRLLIAVIGGADTTNHTGVDTWLNSFTEVNESFNNTSGTKDITGVAMRVVDGDGSTSFSSGATYDHTGIDAGTGQIFSFKVAAAGGSAANSYYYMANQ